MPTLDNYPVAEQDALNSCWASAARSIINWYHSLDESSPGPFDSDQELADAWDAADPGHQHNDINIQQSAAGALEALGFVNNTDERAIPEPDEILDSINNGYPLLAIVGTEQPDPNPNLDYQDGHWVVIVGIDSDQPDATLQVFDPVDGLIHAVTYDAAMYLQPPGVPVQYWQNTSYVDPYEALPLADNIVPLQSGAAKRAAPPPPANGNWQGPARGHITLNVSWMKPFAGGTGVQLTISQTPDFGAPHKYQATLGGSPKAPLTGHWQFVDKQNNTIELTLSLSKGFMQPDSGSSTSKPIPVMRLLADYPVSETEAKHNFIIAKWSLAANPA